MRALAVLAVVAQVGGALGSLLIAPPATAQIKLFPEVLPEPERAAPEQEVSPGQTDEAPPAFRAERLDAPEVDTIALDGGFSPDVFEGARLPLVQALLEAVPADTGVPAIRDLTRRILITSAEVEGASGALLEARARGLLEIGDLTSAAALLAQLPALSEDSGLARLAADVALASGDDERACALAEGIAPASGAAYWGRLTVFCRLLDGDEAGAQLALDLLREAGEDPVSLAVADVAVTGDPGRPLPALRAPEPIHLALLRIAGHPLPREVLVDPSPEVLATLIANPGLAPDLSLHLAEQALLIDALDAADLAGRYAVATPEGESSPGAPGERGAMARAQAWQRLQEAGDPATTAAIIQEVWQAASGRTRFVVAETFGREVDGLTPDGAFLEPAPSLARVLLARDEMVPAARWFDLLRSRGRPGAAGLAPLFAMAGVGGAGAVPVPDGETLGAWTSSRDSNGSALPLLLALLEGSGAPVAESVWWSTLEPPLLQTGAAPSPALEVAAARTGAEQRRGEAILAALALIGDDPLAAPPGALIEALRTLRQVGLDAEAREIAVQIALLAGY